MNKTTILLVDDHALIRTGLKDLLNENNSIEVIGEAGTGHDAIRMIHELQPAIVLLDISLPDMTGIDIIKTVYSRGADSLPRFLLISMFDTDEYYYRAVKAGAYGLIGKNIEKSELYEGIEKVRKGLYYFGTRVREQDVQSIIARLDNLRFSDTDPENVELTNREIDVLAGLTIGKMNKDIALHLGVKIRTVETHRENLMQKFHTSSLQELLSKSNSSEKQRRAVQESLKLCYNGVLPEWKKESDE